jgi:hypothetical protein
MFTRDIGVPWTLLGAGVERQYNWMEHSNLGAVRSLFRRDL